MIQGIVERIVVETEERQAIAKVTLLLVGDPIVYSGEIFTQGNDKLLSLTIPCDEVSFDYQRDFKNYFRGFKNLTLESRALDFSTL